MYPGDFEDEYKKHYNRSEMFLRAWSGIKFSNHKYLQAHFTFIETNCQQFSILLKNLDLDFLFHFEDFTVAVIQVDFCEMLVSKDAT